MNLHEKSSKNMRSLTIGSILFLVIWVMFSIYLLIIRSPEVSTIKVAFLSFLATTVIVTSFIIGGRWFSRHIKDHNSKNS